MLLQKGMIYLLCKIPQPKKLNRVVKNKKNTPKKKKINFYLIDLLHSNRLIYLCLLLINYDR
jgi:hypothetical protein